MSSGPVSVGLHRWGAGPPVVLLHGWTMRGAVWAPLAERLNAASHAPDLPGHGATTGYPPTLEAGVDVLETVLAGHDLRAVTLIGWSLGALIGWLYLARGGDRVARMVSIDMSPRPLPPPATEPETEPETGSETGSATGSGWPYAMCGQSAEKAARGAQRFRADWPGAARAIAQTMFARPEGCAAMSITRAERLIASNDAAQMAAFWESLTQADLRHASGALSVPLLALHGAQSRVYPPETAAWLAQAAPEGRAVVLPGCGHSPNLEDPAATAAIITNFMAG